MTRTCTQCAETKQPELFAKNARGRDGLSTVCKNCVRVLYYLPNREKYMRKARERRATDEGKARERQWQRQRRVANPLVRMLADARRRADRKGWQFDLTESDVSIPAVCPVDSAKGYVRGNVLVISWRANRIKSDATLAELQAITRWLESTCAEVRGK
jgi:hypothetical protein